MSRYVPTRAGIINLWDYRDEEFSFAGGWLILRGPNGSGKTKALEVLFPFVLDGRIDPKRLNPFASEDRTMKSNLLFRGQDTALGYVWLEFRHSGTGEAVTVGVGLHAQRYRDQPARWHFLAEGRVGEDFSLLTADDRPMTRKQLTAELGEHALLATPSDYRAAIDHRLFGLGRERYEQLITLILTLRRPQLAKNLDPAKLSGTLTEGLRPIDDELVAEAARSFDDMEAVQRTLEGLVAADEATRSFLASYTTYLRTHARWAADALTRRREGTAARRGERDAATTALAAARQAQTAAAEDLTTAEDALLGLRARLEQLKNSAAYQALEQLADLERLVRTCAQTAEAAVAELARRGAAAQRATSELTDARATLAELDAAVSRAAATLADEAAAGGIAWTTADAEPSGFAERTGSRVAARGDDLRAVRAALAACRTAEQTRDLARSALDRASRVAAEAEEAAERAARQVRAAREAAAAALTGWLAEHGPILPDGGAELLAEALVEAGEPDVPGLDGVFATATAQAVQELRDEQAGLRAERTAAVADRTGAQAERDRIAAEHDDAPPAFAARTAPRDSRPGAPLWRLVRFSGDLPADRAAGVEAALEGANLLDAWVTPDEAVQAAGESEGFLVPGPAVDGPSLADLLVPEEESPLPAARITAILRSVAVTDTLPAHSGPAISGDGRFVQGIQLGAHHKAAAEYIGATARATRRALRTAECDARIGELTERIAELDRRSARAGAGLDAIAEARDALPRTGAIAVALRDHERAAGQLRATREGADTAQRGFDEAVGACGAAERALRRIGAERALSPGSVEAVAEAVRRFEAGATALVSARREHLRQQEATEGATLRLNAATEDTETAAEAERYARRRHTEEAAKLDALKRTVGAEAAQVLAEVQRAEAGLGATERDARAARTAERDALAEAAAAQARLGAARDALEVAVGEERETARRLAPYAQRELLEVLRCPPGLTWPAQEADWQGGDGLPAGVTAVHEAILTVTRDLTPTEISLKQSTTRLTKALDDLQAQLTTAGQDYRPEWDGADGVIVVRISDEEGPLPVGAFGTKIAASRRDQQDLLTGSEQRILEDALLTRLAQQIHDRTVDARDLIRRMNGEMRSRKMSSGTAVGVSWLLADGLDDEQRAVNALLDTDAARLGPDELGRMRGHFASQIKNARARHRDRPYRELLAEVLDYRQTRQFVFQLVRPGGAEERLTRARHSRLSGGEQSVSLHLPLFAAAHAMLNSARPDAPRLLALDEAFAGVDDTGRSELMGLAAQFDLDLFMTGYDLWATHAAVPAAAHYDLAHSPIDHTVSALLLVWDGSELLADDADRLSTVLGSPGTRRRTAAEDLTGTAILLTEPFARPDDDLRDDGE